MKNFCLAFLSVALVSALLDAPAVCASVVTSGPVSFDTGTPTPTLSFSAPIILTITANGSIGGLVFDDWVTSDGNRTFANASPNSQTVAYTLNGTAGTSPIYGFIDNLNATAGAITANDGYLELSTSFPVTVGQTLIFQVGSYTFGSNAQFNPNLPTVFNGDVFLAATDGSALSALTPVPEPSIWAMLGVGIIGFSVALHRRLAM